MSRESELLDLSSRLQAEQRNLAAQTALKDKLSEQFEAYKHELDAKVEYRGILEKTNVLLQKTAEYQRRQSCQQIERIGTSALQYIMGPGFRLEVELKEISRDEKRKNDGDVRRRPEAEIYIVSTSADGTEVRTKPKDARGGGVVDVVSMALRIALLEVYEPHIDGPIFLDEPGKHVSKEYVSAFAEFLKFISVQLNRQIIMVTHSEFMTQSADLRVEIGMENGVSKVLSTARSAG